MGSSNGLAHQALGQDCRTVATNPSITSTAGDLLSTGAAPGMYRVAVPSGGEDVFILAIPGTTVTTSNGVRFFAGQADFINKLPGIAVTAIVASVTVTPNVSRQIAEPPVN